MSNEFWVAVVASFIGALIVTALTVRASRRKMRREAAKILREMRKGVYRVDHNLNDLEPLISLYNAVDGAMVPPNQFGYHALSEMSLEVITDYERPFRVVLVNGQGTTHRCTFIPKEES